MPVRVVIDEDLCEANGVCVGVAKTVFKLDDDDKLHLLVDAVPDDVLKKVKIAVRRCPKAALALEEVPE